MFFRREKPKVYSFSERMSELRSAGFDVRELAGGKTLVSRKGCAAEVRDLGDGKTAIGASGVLMGEELAQLVDLGFQKAWLTDSGKRAPARAEHLKALHAFLEDLREALGLTSLYNQSLGTTNEKHLYDRVEDRDTRSHPRPWELAAKSH
jgi:hypothetical protein